MSNGKTRVVLIGGVYGGGKTATSKRLHAAAELAGHSPAIVDYDDIIPNGPERTEALRREAWSFRFSDAVEAKIKEGVSDIIIPVGTFTTRERRDRFVKMFGEREDVDLVCLYLMEPMRESIGRIRQNRVDDSELVNSKTYLEHYRNFVHSFSAEDNTDLLLPSNRDHLAPEYRSILARGEDNHRAFHNPIIDNRHYKRWVVLTRPLDCHFFVGLMREGVISPLEIRARMEAHHAAADRGHEARLPRAA